MTSGLNLRVCNPSNYERAGFVIMPWLDTLGKAGIQPHELRRLALHDVRGNPVPFQIDPVDSKKLNPKIEPENPSRAVLVFHLSEKLQPGPEDYSNHSGNVLMTFNITRDGETTGNDKEMPFNTMSEVKLPLDGKLRIEKFKINDCATRLELINSRLVASFGLRPSPDPDDVAGKRKWWYSGSATSVRLGGQEMLAIWNCYDWMGHDPEKRCMQIDRVQVEPHPPGTAAPQEFPLFDRPYELIAESSGPVRVSITVASEPFDYGYYDSSKTWCHLECRLFRVISLYANVDYVVEELFIQRKLKDNACRPGTVPSLDFSARYFACMDMGKDPQIYQFAGVPDWFAVGRPEGYYPQGLHPGYGFACDAHVCIPLKHPVPDYHDAGRAHKTFSWQLQPCAEATCLHLPMHGTPAGFDARTGHLWYEVIYKPLKAQL